MLARESRGRAEPTLNGGYDEKGFLLYEVYEVHVSFHTNSLSREVFSGARADEMLVNGGVSSFGHGCYEIFIDRILVRRGGDMKLRSSLNCLGM